MSELKSILGTVVLGFVLIMFIYMTGYSKGQIAKENEYNQRLKSLEIQNARNIINQEREFRQKQDEIVADYLQQQENLKNEYENQIRNLNDTILRDSFTINECMFDKDKLNSRLSKEINNKSRIQCYTESDLLQKIKASLDIGAECDKLAIKYNSLLEWCKQ